VGAQSTTDYQGDGRIVVLGATGFTGRLIVSELLGLGFRDVVLAGRTRAKLDEVQAIHPGLHIAVADARDPNAVGRSLKPGDVLVNCAGPFTEIGTAVVEAAVGARAHYLDTTGEQGFIHSIYQRLDAPAREAGTAAVPAMAFEYALGACAASALAASLGGPLDSIDLVYGWEIGRSGATTGTRRSVLSVVAGESLGYRAGRFHPLPAGAARTRTHHLGRPVSAFSFPAGEIVMLPRHLDVQTVRGWMVAEPLRSAVIHLLSPILPSLVRAGRRWIEPLLTRGPAGPTDEIRATSRFGITAVACTQDGRSGRMEVRGADPYGLTARIIALAALRILGRADAGGRFGRTPDRPLPIGALDPSQLMDPGEFLRELTRSTLSVDGPTSAG
jgi:short subunit dehydrogenase-like uncharacterized protein